jgi:hypothetical protein
MMEAAHANLKPVNWIQPSDIKTAPAFVVHNHIHYGDIEPSPSNDLYPSWYVQSAAAKSNGTSTTDKISGKTATSCTPDLAKQTSNNSNDNVFSVDIFVNAASANTSGSAGSDDVHNCGDTKPSVTLTVTDTLTQQANVCNGSCTLTATVTAGTHPLNDPQYPQAPGTINFLIGGQIVKSFSVTDSPSTVSFTYVPTTAGSQSVAAQVIDSVMYDASDTANVAFALPTTTGSGNTPSNNQGQGNNGH